MTPSDTYEESRTANTGFASGELTYKLSALQRARRNMPRYSQLILEISHFPSSFTNSNMLVPTEVYRQAHGF